MGNSPKPVENREQARTDSGFDPNRPADGWHQQATQWLLARYDADRSGTLDTPAEVESVPCDDWLGLATTHAGAGLGLSLVRFFGFDGNDYKTGALGIDPSMRDVAYRRMSACGVR